MPIAVTTQVHDELVAAYNQRKYNVFVMEGSSRSSKTYSIIQFLIKYATLNRGTRRRVAICRLKGTWLTATVLHDFINVLSAYGLYNKRDHNKTSKIYTLFDTEFWFMGLDDPQKVHGFESDIFWINEGIEAGYDDYAQLMQRCKGFAIIDYNPSETEHWIYDRILKRPTTWYSHSTFRKNQFISPNAKAQILSYEPTEENFIAGTADERKWKIYGLGQRASLEGIVFEQGKHWEMIKEIPDWAKKNHRFGLDFGYTNDPTAIDEAYWGEGNGNIRFINEIAHQTNTINPEIATIIKLNGLGRVKGYADSAEPKSIDEINLMGVNLHPTQKFQGSVVVGIDILKRQKLYVTERSINTIKELKMYTWAQDKNGVWLNQPVAGNDHHIDEIRYIGLAEWGQEMTPEVKEKTAKAMSSLRRGGRRNIRRSA